MLLASAPASTSSSFQVFLIYAIIILVVILRTVRNYRGVQVSPGRNIGFTIFYFAFGAFLVGPSFFEGVSLIFTVPDVVLLILAAMSSYRFSDQRIAFWKNAEGSIYCKGGIIIYLVYLLGLVARLAIDFLVVGQSAFSFTPGIVLGQSAVIGAVAADLVIMLGVGLLVGRNLRIYKRYQMITEGREKVPLHSA